MAVVTSGRRIDVCTNSSVVRIGGSLGMRVAVNAGEHLVVGGVGMAIPTGSPDLGMGPGVDGEPAMRESGAGPGGGGVAIGAGGGEAGQIGRASGRERV